MCVVYWDPTAMGDLLSNQSNEFFQLHVYFVSIMCVVGSDSIFAVYTNDERPDQTIGARYDMEESMWSFRLGIFSNGLIYLVLLLVELLALLLVELLALLLFKST